MWGMTFSNVTIAAATHAALVAVPLDTGLEGEIGSNLHDATASAIRLNVSYRLTAATQGDDVTMAMGIGWISDTAIAAGGVSVPSPISDHYDWMYHDVRTMAASPASAGGDEILANGYIEIRNNSMRKQRENASGLVAVFQANLLQSTSVQVFVGGRVLFLNP